MKTIVLAVFSLQGGGAERVVQTLARTMNAMGHQAHIVVFKDDIDLLKLRMDRLMARAYLLGEYINDENSQ